MPSTAIPAPATELAAATTVEPEASPSPTAPEPEGFPAGGQLQVDFTYTAAGGGQVHSPYIAVWIEDSAGDLVQTVSLWYKSDESKYLKDLRRWNSKSNRDALTTGATRIPGSFSVSWNGTNLDGTLIDDDYYFVCIEAVREDGPYQIIREAVRINNELQPTTLPANGELTAAAIQLIA